MSLPPDHATLQAEMHAALWAPQTPAGLGQPDTAAKRFSVYRNNVQHGLTRALAARFPTVERILGPREFLQVARVFAATHPPASPVLLEWGGDFPAFLRGFPPLKARASLPDVALLEWLRGRAYHAADAPVADTALLAGIEPERLHLTLAPSVHAFASAHPAVSLWAQRKARGPEYALIARAPGFAVVVEPLAADQHAVLVNLLAGQGFAQAAGASDPTPLLVLLLRHSLITRIGETP